MVPVCVVAWDKRQKFATSPAVSLQLILCRESLVTLQVYKSTSHIKVLKSVQSELLTHEVTQPLSEWWSLKVDSLFLPEWFELYYKLTLEKKWLTYTVCCVGSGVNNIIYHSLSYWSIVKMLPVEFSTGEFRAKQVWKVLYNGITIQEKKLRTF